MLLLVSERISERVTTWSSDMWKQILCEKDFFSSCHERGTKKQFWVSMRNRTSDLRIPHSDALTPKPQRLHGERSLLRNSYDTRPAYCSDQSCRKRNVTLMLCYAFDIADPSSMQVACKPRLVRQTVLLSRLHMPLLAHFPMTSSALSEWAFEMVRLCLHNLG